MFGTIIIKNLNFNKHSLESDVQLILIETKKRAEIGWDSGKSVSLHALIGHVKQQSERYCTTSRNAHGDAAEQLQLIGFLKGRFMLEHCIFTLRRESKIQFRVFCQTDAEKLKIVFKS